MGAQSHGPFGSRAAQSDTNIVSVLGSALKSAMYFVRGLEN